MRLHSIVSHKDTRIKYEVLWYSDYHKLIMLVNKASPTSIPLMLSFETFKVYYEE